MSDSPRPVIDYDDLEPQHRIVKVRKKKYFLCEASADATTKYRNANMRGMRTNDDGKIIGMDGIADAELVLVANCLFDADSKAELPLDAFGNPDRKYLVNEQMIRGWPCKLQKDLFEAIKEMSPSLVEKLPEGATGPKAQQSDSQGS